MEDVRKLCMGDDNMKQKTVVFATGAAGYGCIEVLARGYTHWTMLLLGGLCLTWLVSIATHFHNFALPLQALCGSAAVTLGELGVGLIVNVWLGWNVWDYSAVPFQFMGQICLKYSVCWFAICYAVLGVLPLVFKQAQKTKCPHTALKT